MDSETLEWVLAMGFAISVVFVLPRLRNFWAVRFGNQSIGVSLMDLVIGVTEASGEATARLTDPSPVIRRVEEKMSEPARAAASELAAFGCLFAIVFLVIGVYAAAWSLAIDLLLAPGSEPLAMERPLPERLWLIVGAATLLTVAVPFALQSLAARTRIRQWPSRIGTYAAFAVAPIVVLVAHFLR